MRKQLIGVAALVVACLATSAAGAQPPAGTGARGQAAREHRAEMRDKLKAMTPEERKAALDKAKEKRTDRRESLTDEQKAWAKAMNTELRTTREGVKSGSLTKETAAAQLKAWREANPRPKGNSGN